MTAFVSTVERRMILETIIARLFNLTPEQILTHEDIIKISGMSMDETRYLVRRAMLMLNKSHGLVFENVWKVGYKRLMTAAVPDVGKQSRRKIYRQARATSLKLTNFAAKTNGLALEVAKELNREIAIAGLIELAASKGIASRIEQTETLPTTRADVVKAILGKI